MRMLLGGMSAFILPLDMGPGRSKMLVCCSAAFIAAREKGRRHMSTTQKVHRERGAAEGPEKVDFSEYVGNLVTSGSGRIAEAQKKALDLAVRQNTELVDLWKKTAKQLPGVPGLFLLDLEKSGFERFAEAQRTVIDLMVEQSLAIADLLKERTTETAKATDTAVKFTRQGV